MRITLAELRFVAESLLVRLEESGVESMEIPIDYYWDLSATSRHGVYDTPVDFTMGQFEDDWGEVTSTARGEKEFVPYSLVWLSSVLRAVGEVASGVEVRPSRADDPVARD